MMSTESLHAKEVSELIIKVLSNQASPEECIVLDEWVKKSDENKLYFLRFRNVWLASSQVVKPEIDKTERALEAVTKKIDAPLHDVKGTLEKEIPRDKKPDLYKFARTAALWLLIFGLGAVFSMLIMKPERILSPDSEVSLSTPRGSKAVTALPDGTVILLNAGSRIKYKIPDNKIVRDVTVEGEAYFKVSKDADHPFTVNAEDMIIKAYGTEFNVKAYPEDKVVETTLVEGSVRVEIKNKTSNKTTLRPNEQAIYYMPTSERSENFLVTRGIDPARYTLWINDRLQIKGESLGALAIILERKYDVTIHFNDNTLKNLRFTGIIENETIEQILELIKISSNVDYRISGREIWLSKTGN